MSAAVCGSLVVARFPSPPGPHVIRCRSFLVARVRGERGSGRLDDRADFLDGQQQLAVGLVFADQPVQHVAIEQAPIAPRQHAGAVARPDADEPFSRKRLDRLANHAAADAETAFKFVFGWQHCAGRDDFPGDLAAECSSAPRGCGPASNAFQQILRVSVRKNAFPPDRRLLAPAGGQTIHRFGGRSNHPMLNIRCFARGPMLWPLLHCKRDLPQSPAVCLLGFNDRFARHSRCLLVAVQRLSNLNASGSMVDGRSSTRKPTRRMPLSGRNLLWKRPFAD